MNKRLSWFVPLALGAFLVAACATPALSQDKARLVNPKKKKAEKAEPAPVEEQVETTETVEPEEAQPASSQAKEVQAVEAAPAKTENVAKEATKAKSKAEETATTAVKNEPRTKRPKKAKAPKESAPSTRAAQPTPAVAATDRPTSDRTPPPTRRSDEVRDTIVVTEVLLDVLVTDKKGNVVTGLGPEDFVISEQDKQLPATSSTFYGTETELKGSGVAGQTRSDRYFILLIHDQRQVLPALTAAQVDLSRWAKKWVENEMQPNDQVAVLSYNNRLKLYQDFTRDPRALTEAINKAALGKKDLDLYKTTSAPEFDPNSPSLFVNLPSGAALSKQTRKIQEALGLIGRAAEGIVGRKNLMFFSLGWDDPDLSPTGWVPDNRYYPDMKESLNAGNVAVYSVDLLGSRRGGFSGSTSIADSLSSISTDTGGHYYYNFANPMTPIRQVADDNLGYYLLSYTSEYPTGARGYQEVTVETKNSEYKVRARKGYRYGQGNS